MVELQEPRISVVCQFAFSEGRKLPGFEDRKVPDLKYIYIKIKLQLLVRTAVHPLQFQPSQE